MNKAIACLCAALFAAVSVSAQTPLPARQVSANTNGWDYLSPTANTAQATFDDIDLKWDPRPSAAGWSSQMNSLTSEVPLLSQDVFDFLDGLLVGIPPGSHLMKGTNIVGATFADDQWSGFEMCPTNWNYVLGGSAAGPWTTSQAVWDWVDLNWGLTTSGWSVLDPSNATYGVADETSPQEAWDHLDGLLADWGAGGGLLKGTNIIHATYSNGQWTVDNNYVPGTNIVGATLASNQWTGLMPGTNIAGLVYTNGLWLGALTTNSQARVWRTSFRAVRSADFTNGTNHVVSAYESVANADGTTTDPSWFSKADGVFYVPEPGRYHLYTSVSGQRNSTDSLDLLISPIVLSRGSNVSLVTEVYAVYPQATNWPAESFHMETHAIVNLYTNDAVYVTLSAPYRAFAPPTTNLVGGLTVSEVQFGASLLVPYYPSSLSY